ncbi:MAG TPA: hypothetical protein DER64_15365 [Planctomycetaceae bacterium]|nr:hypothetical protein [Planctomycetaceae bacterium]
MTLFVSQAVMAQDEGRTKLDWGDWASGLSVGAGLRASYNTGDPIGATNDFNLDNARLYVNATGHDILGLELNFDINNAQGFGVEAFENGEFRVLDAILKIEFGDLVNIWMGRMIAPSDRANLSGPYFQNNWAFPYTQFGYYNIFQGRDDGVTLYGDTGDDVQFKWSIGVFEGHNNVAGEDDVWVVGRAVLNFLDKEEGYFNQSTYYGEKEIAAIGVSFSNQDDAHAAGADYTAWSLDVLYERPLDSGGVLTAEAAYYDRDDDDDAAGFGRQGEGYFLLGSYLFSDSLSIGNLEGRLQPSIRYQESDRDDPQAGDREHQVDYSLNYIIHGHSARVSLVFQDINVAGGAEDQQNLIIGGQVRF